MTLGVVILAAGRGSRMKSGKVKPLMKICGQSLISRIIETAKKLDPEHIIVVTGSESDLIEIESSSYHDEKIRCVKQPQPIGTADALSWALPYLQDVKHVLALVCDIPLITEKTLKELINNHHCSLSILSTVLDDPTGYGRIVMNPEGEVAQIIEEADLSGSLASLSEVNTGIMLFDYSFIFNHINEISNHNSKQEYYLTDAVMLANEKKYTVKKYCTDNVMEVTGVNTLMQLQKLEMQYKEFLISQYLQEGVYIRDPQSLVLDGKLIAEQGVEIGSNVTIQGVVNLKSGVVIQGHCYLKDVSIDQNVCIKPFTHIEGAFIESGTEIGPFARIRPKSVIGPECRIGNFVEIKNTSIKGSTKVGHLSYLGDAHVGKNVNIGAGTITCNYNGVAKFTTQIEDNCFVGSGSELIAPLTIQEGAFVAAGTTVTKDVLSGALAISRYSQKTIPNWISPIEKEPLIKG